MISKGRICDAFGCDLEAIKSIEVSAGKYGTLSINVCRKCEKIFEKEDTH